MTTIASTSNPRLKGLRRLQTKRGRAASGQFAAEGEDLLAAAERAGVAPLEGFRLAGSGLGAATFPDVEGRGSARRSRRSGSGTRVIGVYAQRWAARPAGPLCVYLHGVRDPGNIGTVLRSAEAFGASCVALGPGCADPHSPKAVRASMGAIFAVPLARAGARERAAGPPDRALGGGLADAGRGAGGGGRGDHAADRLRARGPAGGARRRLRGARAHPDRDRVAERGDGGDRGALRDDPQLI